MKRSPAIARTIRRLPSEKSTSARSMVPLPPESLLDGVLEDKRLRDYSLPRCKTRHDFLQMVRQAVAAPDLHTLELTRPDRHVHPFPVVEVEDGRCWNDRPSLLRLTMEGCGDEHADAHQPGVGD